MTAELTVLALAILLQAVQFGAYSIRANLDVGPGYAMSARDRAPSRPMSDLGGRLQRALTNHFEGLILFTAAVTLVTLSDQSTTFTAACAWAYLGARILYVPSYALDLSPWRSVVWMAGFFATILMVISTLI
ncbi:membrane protein [Jannaschia pagri]|uniref:Membrane protein n=1 Tax=Jannaschia pagri TaxID=2829797 RepID=A0ABQ4NL52_9RHOB|nr:MULTISPECIES: MAPEG family protein [unclassified Jannaschia]GIT91310.1 membrane protein [Jannaschia sp. AI_61]GIT95143.1 membrane protein [Jannaschia sp. AI_62]